MKELTCVVVGGGYAGINAIKAMQKATQQELGGRKLRLILIDKQPHHLRKVLLFKPASDETNITIPFSEMFPKDVRFVQGAVSSIAKNNKELTYEDANGQEQVLSYDVLILAVGSIVRQPAPEQGGIALTGIEAAARMKKVWRENMLLAVKEANEVERKRLLTVAIAGAGISGIETSAELAHAMQKEANKLGIDSASLNIYLLDSQSRLFQNGPAKVGKKLERILAGSGVKVLHDVKALKERDGELLLSDGRAIAVGLSIWTLGLMPNPIVQAFGLPLTPENQLKVDECYRVHEAPGVYSIGDCARILDPSSGLADTMTCKEALAQAARLGKIITADLSGTPAPSHKRYMDVYCVGLGPNRGVVWTRQWGLDILIGGKLGWKIRKLTWDEASLMK